MTTTKQSWLKRSLAMLLAVMMVMSMEPIKSIYPCMSLERRTPL